MANYDAYRYDNTERRVTGTRWATDAEICESLTRVNLTAPHYPACGLPVASNGRVAYVNNSDSHALIMGSTGSKKSRLFVMPMMEMIAKAGESVVVNDPKGELYERTSGLFAQEGYDIQVINLREPLRGNGWNPIRHAYEMYTAGRTEEATALINDLAKSIFSPRSAKNVDPFWEQSAGALFQGLCHMLIEGGWCFTPEQMTFDTLPSLVDNLTVPDSGETGLTNELLEFYPANSMARMNLRAARGTSKTFENIMVSYNAPMQVLYSQRALMAMLSRHEVSFDRLGEKKSILYIIMPDEKTTLHFLVSLIVKQCYEALISLAQRQEERTLPVRVNFLLDEFSNLPAIPDMSAMISAARSRNIRFYLVVQSMHQLTSKYGEDAQTIRGNCNDWVFLTSRELDLLQELEALCGVNARTGEALISVSQLQRLNRETGEALVLCGRNYPFIAHLADIDEYPFAHVPAVPLPVLVKKGMEPVRLEEIVDRANRAMTMKEPEPFDPKKTYKESEHLTPSLGSDEDDPDDLYEELDKKFMELYGNKKKG